MAFPLVGVVRDALVDAIGPSLIGLYVYGSLATGDFEPHTSDIDLIAVLREAPDEALVRRLGKMHEDLARAETEWRDRIEVDYVSEAGLTRCRTHPTTIVRISPGEPLHLIEAGRDFLLDWSHRGRGDANRPHVPPARRDGISLEGPPLDSLVPPIPEAEYLEEVRMYLDGFRDRFDGEASAGSQAYAILTMCRGVAALRFGERLSKREAGARIQREFPRWSDLIDRALGWRDRQWSIDQPDGAETVRETRAFIAEMHDVLERSPGPARRT